MSSHMSDGVHWVDKAEGAREPEASPSTPYRMIRRVEVAVAGEGRRVCGKMRGPCHPGDRGLLRRVRVERPEFTVGILAEGFSRLQPAGIIDAAGIPYCLFVNFHHH